MKGKNILISGWYGHGNIGDEAILKSIIDIVIKNDKNAKITIMSFCPAYTRKNHKVEAVHQLPFGFKSWILFFLYFRWIRTSISFLQSNVFILGGGGFISDWQPEAPRKWLRQAMVAKLLGKKSVLFGVGIGPLKTLIGEKTTKNYISKYVDRILVRDHHSKYVLVKQLGITYKEVMVLPDPAITFKIGENIVEGKEGFIGVVYADYFLSGKRNCDDKKRDNLILCYRAQIDTLLLMGEKVKLFFFHKDNDYALRKKFEEIYKDKVSFENNEKYFETIRELSKCKAVISFRLHGLILSYALGLAFFPIVYHQKTRGFLDEIEFDNDNLLLEVGDGYSWPASELDIKEWKEKTNLFLGLVNSGKYNFPKRLDPNYSGVLTT